MVHPLGAIQQHIMKIKQHTVMIISLQEMDIGLLDGTRKQMEVELTGLAGLINHGSGAMDMELHYMHNGKQITTQYQSTPMVVPIMEQLVLLK